MTTPIEEQLAEMQKRCEVAWQTVDDFRRAEQRAKDYSEAIQNSYKRQVADLTAALATQTERADAEKQISAELGRLNDKLAAEVEVFRSSLDALKSECAKHLEYIGNQYFFSDFKTADEMRAALNRLTAELDAVRKERDKLRKDVDAHRFFVPDAMLQNFQQYIHDVPACEIVNGGILVSPDSLLKLSNDLKNAMADAVNAACDQRDTAQARCAELEKAIQEAPHDGWCNYDYDKRNHPIGHERYQNPRLCNCWKSRISEQKPAQEQGKAGERVNCPSCNDSGWVRGVGGVVACPVCSLKKAPPTPGAKQSDKGALKDCEVCGGCGIVGLHICRACAGFGYHVPNPGAKQSEEGAK